MWDNLSTAGLLFRQRHHPGPGHSIYAPPALRPGELQNLLWDPGSRGRTNPRAGPWSPPKIFLPPTLTPPCRPYLYPEETSPEKVDQLQLWIRTLSSASSQVRRHSMSTSFRHRTSDIDSGRWQLVDSGSGGFVESALRIVGVMLKIKQKIEQAAVSRLKIVVELPCP